MTDRRDTLAAAVVAGLVAMALVFGAQRGRRSVARPPAPGEATTLAGESARFVLHPAAGRLEVVTSDGASRLDLDLSLVVDGVERPLAMRAADVHPKDKTTLVAEVPVELGAERATAKLELAMDPSSDVVTARVVVAGDPRGAPHAYALRVGLAPEGRSLFLPGVGGVADVTGVDAKAVVVDDDVHPFALASTQRTLHVAEIPPDVAAPGAEPRIVATAKTDAAKSAHLDVSVVVGASSQRLWGRLDRIAYGEVAPVRGVVTGTASRAHVFAADEEGRPLVRAIVDPDGRFAVEAPPSAVLWYAAIDAVQTSAPVRFAPGTPWDLRLDVSAGGELRVRISDADTKAPLLARLNVKGIEGTLDPTFGPDYRGSGAGPLIDVIDGEVATPLPAGKYRVLATKGIEYSIDAEEVEIESGKAAAVELALRHVVPTPGAVGCDLHVHARPSFDSPVTPEDRVVSLLSAGVEFAVPTEHNVVGDYGPALEVLGLGRSLAHVTGVEVTTFNPRFGHFGVFPWPTTGSLPPYRGTNAGAIIASARRGDPSRVVQVNHPRLASGIGYFGVVKFDPKSGRIPSGMRTDFDTIEVYNGYEMGNRARVEQVMTDWFALLNLGKRIAATGSSDSHRIQYQWAGYPRTYALVDPRSAGDGGQPVDVREVVLAIKKGRSFVTSGPIVELELGRAKPGDEVPARLAGEVLEGALRIRAAPWVDVTSVEIVAGIAPSQRDAPGKVIRVFDRAIPSLPTKLGDEPGTLAEAAGRSVRLDVPLALRLPEGARWIVAVVRGDRPLDDALPFMPVQPLAFTNPIWIGH